MAARINIPSDEMLSGEVEKLAANWKAIGSDTAFIRLLGYRSELIPAFFDFYLRLRGDGLLSARIKALARLRIARLNTCRY